MRINIYAMYDKVAQDIIGLMPHTNDNLAKRSFCQGIYQLKQQQEQAKGFTTWQDIELWKLGSVNSENLLAGGEFSSERLLENAVSLIEELDI